MNFQIRIDHALQTPIYRQIVESIEAAVKSGALAEGEHVPSMNEIADREGISRETVKKAYGILVKRDLLRPHQGKGFFAHRPSGSPVKSILVIFDRLSIYRQITFNAFTATLGDRAQVTILTHNQSTELLEYYLDRNLDSYDYYVVSPHFALDRETQTRVTSLLRRIPNRKLILMDKIQDGLKGNFGAVYQDFRTDIELGLAQCRDDLSKMSRLCVLILPTSLYGQMMTLSIENFCAEIGLPVEFVSSVPEEIRRGDCFLVINSQLDWGLSSLARQIAAQDLVTGEDVKIISYNEFPIAELVLGGLSTLSTDFAQMGDVAARMILDDTLRKVHCDFRLIKRNTFK